MTLPCLPPAPPPPGSRLTIKINTTRGHQSFSEPLQTTTPTLVWAVLAYLKSYQHMGKASIR